MPTKQAISSTKPRRVPQTRESDQGYVVPPHCRASSRQMIPGMKAEDPIKSSLRTRSMTGRWVVGRRGGLNTRTTTRKATAPSGRLIQKHHRQLNLSVSAPPKRGPVTEATARYRLEGIALPRHLRAASGSKLGHVYMERTYFRTYSQVSY
jgi:hypothetical protein